MLLKITKIYNDYVELVEITFRLRSLHRSRKRRIRDEAGGEKSSSGIINNH